MFGQTGAGNNRLGSGVDLHTQRWIRNFVVSRTARVKVDDEYSAPTTMRAGVPQGTILGPLLFLVYIEGPYARR